jgi:hypothetical protein
VVGGHKRLVGALYTAVKPDPAALEFAGRAAGLADPARDAGVCAEFA